MSVQRRVYPRWVILSAMLLLAGCLKASAQPVADGTLAEDSLAVSTDTYFAFTDVLADPDELAPASVNLMESGDNTVDSTTSVAFQYSLFLETRGDNTTSVKKSDPEVDMDGGDYPSEEPSTSERYSVVDGDIMVEPNYDETDTPTGSPVPTTDGSESTVETTATAETTLVTESTTPGDTESVTERQKDLDSSEEDSNEVSGKKCKHCSQQSKHQHTRNHHHQQAHKHKKGGDNLTKMIQECIRDSISEHESRKEMWSEETVKDVVNSCIDKFR